MSTNIKVIRYTAIASAVFAIFTYLISINIAFEWFEWRVLPNNFLLTIFGGAFASMLVIFICEIQKYLQNKRLTQDALFAHVSYVYAYLYVIKTILKCKLENNKEAVYEDLISINLEKLKQEIEIIKRIDYVLISKKNDFGLRHKSFCDRLISDLDPFISEGTYLSIAVKKDQINNLITTGSKGVVTSSSYYTNAVIKKMIRRTNSMIFIVAEYVKFIDDCCKNRYVWELTKTSLEKAANIEAADIDDYIKE